MAGSEEGGGERGLKSRGGGTDGDLLTQMSLSPDAGRGADAERVGVIFNFGFEREWKLTSDPKLRFGEEIFEAELGGAADGNGLGDALENEVCLVPGFSVDAGNLF